MSAEDELTHDNATMRDSAVSSDVVSPPTPQTTSIRVHGTLLSSRRISPFFFAHRKRAQCPAVLKARALSKGKSRSTSTQIVIVVYSLQRANADHAVWVKLSLGKQTEKTSRKTSSQGAVVWNESFDL